MVLTADKGRANIVMDVNNYHAKMSSLIENGPYQLLYKDPTDRLTRKLSEKLLTLKRSGHLTEAVYNKIRPQHKQPPRIYDLPKIHMNKARQAFLYLLYRGNSFDQRTLFRASKRLFNQSQYDGLPPNLHAPTFANNLGKYFVTKIDTIRRQIDAAITDLTVPVASITVNSNAMVIPTLSAFKTLSDKEVKSIIHNSALKTCQLETMLSRSVSKFDTLLPVRHFNRK